MHCTALPPDLTRGQEAAVGLGASIPLRGAAERAPSPPPPARPDLQRRNSQPERWKSCSSAR